MLGLETLIYGKGGSVKTKFHYTSNDYYYIQ